MSLSQYEKTNPAVTLALSGMPPACRALARTFMVSVSFWGALPALAQTETGARSAEQAIAYNGWHVLEHALEFAALLSPEQHAALMQPYTFANASRWHNYPQWSMGARGRIGLRLETLSEAQWEAFDALLAAATGSGPNEGYDEIRQHLDIDDYLRENNNPRYGRGDFHLAFLGAPSNTGLWQLQFGGHHLALTNTYRDGVLIGATPSFRGVGSSQPIEHNGTSLAPLRQEMDALLALLASLDERQLASARLSGRFADIVMGAGNDWIFPENAEGLSVSVLGDRQRDLLVSVIATYVGDADDANAAVFLERYERELDETYIGYSGSIDFSNAGDYIRIDGPSLWIELVMDTPYNFPGPHPHTVWRDKQTDYGGTRG